MARVYDYSLTRHQLKIMNTTYEELVEQIKKAQVRKDKIKTALYLLERDFFLDEIVEALDEIKYERRLEQLENEERERFNALSVADLQEILRVMAEREADGYHMPSTSEKVEQINKRIQFLLDKAV